MLVEAYIGVVESSVGLGGDWGGETVIAGDLEVSSVEGDVGGFEGSLA